MTAYSKPAAQEQIVVPLKSAARAASPARRSAEQPRATLPEVAVEACLGFSESRRTGNIEVTFEPPAPRQSTAQNPSAPSPILQAAPLALHARPRPHAAMPVPQGDFGGDLRQVDAEAPAATHGEAIESLMADARKEPPGESSCRDPAAAALQTGMDVRLARIMDAWPRLSARTRAALAATLDSSQSPDTLGGAATRTAPVPLAVASPRRTEGNSSCNRRRRRTKE